MEASSAGPLVMPQTGVSVGQLVRPACFWSSTYGLILINLQDVAEPGPRRRDPRGS